MNDKIKQKKNNASLSPQASPGWEMVAVRQGEVSPGRFYINPYVEKAAQLKGMLFTLPELEALVESASDSQTPVEPGVPGNENENGQRPGIASIFANPAQPLVLDIGCYKGLTVIEMAEKHPGFNVLGIDLRYKRVVKSCQKIIRAGFTNAKIVVGHASALIDLLPDNSLFGALVFFPDPWQKERQKKHRFMSPQFIAKLSRKLVPGGFTWFKTDCKEYFDDVTAIMPKAGFLASTKLPANISGEEYRTVFENLFIRKNLPVYRAMFIKRTASATIE